MTSRKTLIFIAVGLAVVVAGLFVYSVVPDAANLVLTLLAVGLIPVVLTWLLTRRIQFFWLRIIPRIVVISLVFGWAIVPVPELHGALPFPIPFALWVGFKESKLDQVIPAVAFSVALTASVLWIFTMAVWLTIRLVTKPRVA